MRHSRRDFLRIGSRVLGTTGAASALYRAGLVRAAAQSSSQYKALVCIFLFGGNDSNNLLVPNDSAGYANYAKIRQNLAIPQASLVPIVDSLSKASYGLHPSFAPLAPLYNTSKRLALVANVGALVRPIPRDSGKAVLAGTPLPRNLYSHSDQQTAWQTALAQGGATSGWSGRAADRAAASRGGALPPAITVAGNVMQMVGEVTQASAVNTASLALAAPATDPGSAALQQIVDLPGGGALVQAAQASLRDATSMGGAINSALSRSAGLGVTFPGTDIGTQLGQVAKLIQVRQSFGATRQIFFCSQGGYDTHSNQVQLQTGLYTSLAAALLAFDNAMGALDLRGSVTVFTESDFGRTFQPNGNAGTDHGWGSHAIVMGGAVNGGAVYGTYPTLALGGPDDSTARGTWVPALAIEQYAAALAKWFGVTEQADLDYAFPNLGNFNYQTVPVV